MAARQLKSSGRFVCSGCGLSWQERTQAETCHPNVVKLKSQETVSHRTQAEIVAQLEARYATLETEAAAREERSKLPDRLYPCRTCKWGGDAACKNALIVGFRDEIVWNWSHVKPEYRDELLMLCGPEKALWEPRTLWQRFGVPTLGLTVIFAVPFFLILAAVL